MVSTRPPTSKSSSPFSNPLVTVPNAPITIGIIVTCMFHSFFNFLARSRYLSFFLHSFSFILWSAGTVKSTIIIIIIIIIILFSSFRTRASSSKSLLLSQSLLKILTNGLSPFLDLYFSHNFFQFLGKVQVFFWILQFSLLSLCCQLER